jgi:hypothetical protein
MISSYRKTVFTSENTSSSMVADGGRRRHGHDDRWKEETQQTKGGGASVPEKPNDHIPRRCREEKRKTSF